MKMMETSLTARHYHVVAATTGAAALERVAADEPDVMIVDLGLPDIDGLDLCRHLRLWSKSPIVVVTADGSQERMVQALDEGADDYVVKPFSMEELLARVRVALRHRNLRSPADAAPSIVVGALTLDVEAHIARIAGRQIDLPPRQFKLLTVLARDNGRIVTYRRAIHSLWGPENDEPASHALRILVSQLRKSLGVGDGVPRIVTEPYVGYRLVESDGSGQASSR